MSTEKKSALDYIKMHPVFSSRTSAATELNKLINTKEERKAAGLDYKAGGYVLSAEDKRRRKTFKSSKATKNNTGMKKLKEGGMVIVDRNYLKGK